MTSFINISYHKLFKEVVLKITTLVNTKMNDLYPCLRKNNWRNMGYLFTASKKLMIWLKYRNHSRGLILWFMTELLKLMQNKCIWTSMLEVHCHMTGIVKWVNYKYFRRYLITCQNFSMVKSTMMESLRINGLQFMLLDSLFLSSFQLLF